MLMNGNMKTLKTVRSLFELNRCAFIRAGNFVCTEITTLQTIKYTALESEPRCFTQGSLGLKSLAAHKGQRAMKSREEAP